jgi:hypothetical protein
LAGVFLQTSEEIIDTFLQTHHFNTTFFTPETLTFLSSSGSCCLAIYTGFLRFRGHDNGSRRRSRREDGLRRKRSRGRIWIGEECRS